MARIPNPERSRGIVPAASTLAARGGRVRAARAVIEPLSIALPDTLPLYRGGELHAGRVAYETWGHLSAARDNAVLLFTGLSPSAHAASNERDSSPGWWQRMIGPGMAINTDRYFVICINSLGSCFGSSGPASIDPRSGQLYRLDFPEIAVEDIARAGFEVAKALGITQLDSVIGASLGGMTVLAFATQFAGATRRLISISGSPAASPFAIALRSVQREAVLRDPQWQGGQYPRERPPLSGMRLARKLGTITYRSAAEWRQRFGRKPLAGNAHAVSPFAPGSKSRATWRRRPSASRVCSIRTATCICHEPWIASIWRSTVAAFMLRCTIQGSSGPWYWAWKATCCSRFTSRPKSPRHCRRAPSPPASRACPRSKATTLSWSTSRVSTPKFAPSWPETPAAAAARPLRAAHRLFGHASIPHRTEPSKALAAPRQ